MPYEKTEVPMEIEGVSSWISWVSAATTCLRALGQECDSADVGAWSGYAFALTINDGCCVSGPTCVDWSSFGNGVVICGGRSVSSFVSFDCFTGEHKNDRTRAHAKHAFDLVAREVAEGRPCVVWGLGVPEFGVVHGVDGEDYLCIGSPCTPKSVRHDAIDAPGGPAIWTFPTPNVPHPGADRYVVRRAAQSMMKLTR